MTSSVADALVGRVIDGRYRILSHLADGGMASVYVALDGRLDREVALKIMRPGLATDAVFVERFRAEARSAARLSHPNVVAVFDQGEDDGEVFLAMELVEGKTLRDVIHEEAPLTAREALAILEPILLALRAAHAAGMIHRDVKPENVIVRRDGEVKVADFGLARAITNQATTSQTGVLLGTVSYLSPEQVERGVADTAQRRVRRRPAPLRDAHRAQGRHRRHPDPDRVQPRPRLDRRPVAVVPDRSRPRSTTSSPARRPLEPDDRFESADGLRRRPARGPPRPDRGRARPARRRRRARPCQHLGAAAHLADDAACPVPTGRPAPVRTVPARSAHRTRPNELGRAALAGLPVHDDGPVARAHRSHADRPTPAPGRRRRWPLWLAAAPRRRRVPRSAAGGSRPAPAARPSCRRSSASRSRRPKARCEQASLSVETVEEFSEVKAKGVVLRVEPERGQRARQATRPCASSSPRARSGMPSPTSSGLKAADAGAALSP